MIASLTQSDLQSRRINKKIMLVWGFGFLISMAIVWGSAFAKIQADREELINLASVEVGARAKTYAEQVLRTVMQIDQLSLVIKYQWERKSEDLDLEGQFHKGVYQNALYPVAINAQGIALTDTRNLPKGTFMGDLDFFKFIKNTPDSGLVISQPAAGRGGFAGKTIIRFSRRLQKSDGAFDGVVLIAIEPNFIVSYQDSAMLSKDDFISVHFIDGPLMASKVGGNKNKIPDFYHNNPEFSADQGSLIETADKFEDNETRIVGWKKLAGYPLITIAAISEKNALSPYASTAKTYLGIASAVSLLMIFAAFTGALNQMRAAARHRYKMQVQSTFRMAVDGAREGFYMIRPVHKSNGNRAYFLIEDCNERAAEMSGYKRQDLIGKHVDELFQDKTAESVQTFLVKVLEKGFMEDEFHVLDGKRHDPGWFQRRAVRSGSGIAVTIRDVSEVKQQAQHLAAMARTDALTGLPNRHWLNDYLPEALEQASLEGHRVALLYIDLDDFKDINDSLGHKAGDEVLCAVARALRNAVRTGDHLARLGGDEFIVIIENLERAEDAAIVGNQLLQAIGKFNSIAPWEIFSIRASIGISVYPTDGKDLDSLLQSADIAMYAAKSEGKAQYCHYDEKFAQKIRDRISTERALEQAVRDDEFVLFYQPRADAITGKLCSMEALLRWNHPERGLTSPAEFISIAEQCRLIIPIGELVIEKVCSQIAQWRQAGLPLKPVSINVSALQLKDDRLRMFLVGCMHRYSITPALIAIELTESRTVDEDGVTPDELRRLREIGIELQIDDFGTGYSSLSKLQELDIDVVKIDQSFVRKLGMDQQSNALCEAIVSIGRALDITVVAEGVETVEQLHILQKMGCEEIQGYLVSRPLPADKIPELMGDRQFFEPYHETAA